MRTIGGIFVGGAATRFGGIAKGLLRTADGTSIVERTIAILRALEVEPVLVGQRPEYASLGIASIPDHGEELGPLGGFVSLYGYDQPVIALACDMPHIQAESIARLVARTEPLVAARRRDRWEPFFSRHDPGVMRPLALANVAAKRLALQALFDRAAVLDVDPHELDDWDSPEEVAQPRTMPIRTMSK